MMTDHRIYIWPFKIEPTYNLKVIFLTKESMQKLLYFPESAEQNLSVDVAKLIVNFEKWLITFYCLS